MNVKQLMAAIEYLGLKEEDEITTISMDGVVLDCTPEIQGGKLFLHVDVVADTEDDSDIADCLCGEPDCHYCGG